MSSLKKGVFSSIILVAQSILNKLVGLVSTLILARVLLPEDFGIVAIATLTIGFFEILSNTGAVQYLLKADKISDADVNTSWTINLILRFVLVGLIIAASFFAADFYDDRRIQELMLVLSVIFFTEALQNPAIIYLKRNQEYLNIVKVTLVGKLAAVMSAVSIALYFESYWALVAGQAVNKASMLIGYYVIYPYKPKLILGNAKKQWSFSGWMIPQSILGYLRTQLDTFLASAMFGKAELGSYHTMKYIAYIPTADLLTPITEPLLVELRKAKVDSSHFNTMFNASLVLSLLLAVPISVFVFFFHEITTTILLGENWVPYSELLGGFCLLITSAAFHQQCSKTLLVFDRPKHLFIYEIMTFIFIYSILFSVGFDDLVVFTYVRVGIEQFLLCGFLIYISLKYTNFVHLIKLTVLISCIFFSAVLAAIIASTLVIDTNILTLDLILMGLVYLVSFIAVFVVQFIVFLRRFAECQYIISVVARLLPSVSSKMTVSK